MLGCSQSPHDVTIVLLKRRIKKVGSLKRLFVLLISYKPTEFRRWVVDTKKEALNFLDQNKEEFEGCRVKVLMEKEDEVEVHKE